MKNLFTLLFIVSFVFTNNAQAQNITNTLGANGDFKIDNSFLILFISFEQPIKST